MIQAVKPETHTYAYEIMCNLYRQITPMQLASIFFKRDSLFNIFSGLEQSEKNNFAKAKL